MRVQRSVQCTVYMYSDCCTQRGVIAVVTLTAPVLAREVRDQLSPSYWQMSDNIQLESDSDNRVSYRAGGSLSSLKSYQQLEVQLIIP